MFMKVISAEKIFLISNRVLKVVNMFSTEVKFDRTYFVKSPSLTASNVSFSRAAT